MSGGHFDYQQHHIRDIADSIEEYLNGREVDEDDMDYYLKDPWLDDNEKRYLREHKRTIPNQYEYSKETLTKMRQIHDFEGNTKAFQNMAAFNRGIKFALDQLFGSKCLPDDANEDNFVSKEPQPTETFTDDCNSQSKTASMSTLSPKNVEYPHIASKESHYRNLSQETANCDKQFDAIIKDGFAKERRLNIAAMIEPALISNPDLWKRCGNYYAGPGKDTAHSFAELALEYADALISKADKGKKK